MGGSKENRHTPGTDHWSIAVKNGKALENQWRKEIPVPRGGPHRLRFLFRFYLHDWVIWDHFHEMTDSFVHKSKCKPLLFHSVRKLENHILKTQQENDINDAVFMIELVLLSMISFSWLAVKRVTLWQNRGHLSSNAHGGMRCAPLLFLIE